MYINIHSDSTYVLRIFEQPYDDIRNWRVRVKYSDDFFYPVDVRLLGCFAGSRSVCTHVKVHVHSHTWCACDEIPFIMHCTFDVKS